MDMSCRLCIVVPCYNEEEALPVTGPKFVEHLRKMVADGQVAEDSKIIFVNDGSKDATWEVIKALHDENKEVVGLNLAHNRGHQNALMAGLMYAKDNGDVAISIDADLQQDINAMSLFIDEYKKGCDVVFGVRNSRETDSFFKRTTAGMFYKFSKWLGCDLYENSADYRLMSSKALEALSEYGEVNLFLRGIIPTLGFKTSVVHFDVSPRMQGESKYSLRMMIKLALDGITSFSIKPIRLVFLMGVAAIFIAVVMLIHILIDYINNNVVQGWSSILASIWILGGNILLSIGVVGEYVGRNYMETKKRPRYFVSEIVD